MIAEGSGQRFLPLVFLKKRLKMATSSERSPPPFPESEDQDVLDSEEVRGRDSDEDEGEDFFGSPVCSSGVKLAVALHIW